MWKVTLRPQQRKAPLNRTGPTSTPNHHTALSVHVAARLMTLLWLGRDSPTQNYPRVMEEDMPSIQFFFFSTLGCLQQAHPHILELTWTPPRITDLPEKPRQRQNATKHGT